MVAHRGGESLETRGAGPAHAGDCRGDQVHAEQIGQTLLGQQLIVQQIDHDRREARAVLHRRGHVFGELRARLGTAIPANAGTGAVFRDNQGQRFGEVEHLPRGMTRGHRPGQISAASRTGLGEMLNGRIGCFAAAQRFAGMAFLSAGPLA
jgi:hypothetical protein